MSTAAGSTAPTVVVGGGAAGCVVARRLAERGEPVLLLEAGCDDPAVARALAGPGRIPAGADWGVTATVDGRDAPLRLPRIRALGGTSLIQGGIALRGLPGDYDAWGALAGPSWSHRGLLPYLRRLEADQDYPDDRGHGTDGPLPISRPGPAARQPLHTAFLDGCAELGLPSCEDHNGGGAGGAGPVPLAGDRRGKATARDRYLEPVLEHPGLTVRTGVEAVALEFAGDRAVGVLVRAADGGAPRRIPAGRVVLAAGAVGTPALLQRSGIGDPAALRAAGLPVRAALPGVGTLLRDHPAVHLPFGLDSGHGTEGRPWFQVLLRLAAGQVDGLADTALEVYHDFRLGLPLAHRRALLVASLLSSEGTGVVEPGAFPGPPRVRFHYTGRDLADLTAAAALGLRWLGTGAARTALRPRRVHAPGGSAGVLHALTTAHHLHGGAPMGDDPDTGGVVDRQARVHGLRDLWVADVSICPVPVRANTHLLALAVAERVSDLLTAATDPAPGG
ncbi:GMC family oxidoreductase [Streptacidiphilus cavernicola]|uniref:GMC family oxidoreductase n=1 Tax=Streptacidiphilus cavernicola TaxID=3342716 RepID=A0ABV6VSZ7_9ACTN